MLDIDKLEKASALQVLSFQVRLLTPLFSHGWQKTETKSNKLVNTPIAAETRSPSLRGTLRYWWRLVQPENNIEQLLEMENKVFGGTAGGDNGVKSPVTIRIKPISEQEARRSLRPHRNETMVLAIPATNQDIEISLIINPILTKQTKEYYKAVMHFYFCLGSMGQRARRGTGAIQFTDFRWNTVQDFGNTLKSAMDEMGVASNYDFPQISGPGCVLRYRGQTNRDRIRLSRVWVGKPFGTAEEARSAISAAASQNNPPSRNQMLGSANSRMASPLWCTIREINRRFHPVVSEITNPKMNDSRYRENRNGFLSNLGVKDFE